MHPRLRGIVTSLTLVAGAGTSVAVIVGPAAAATNDVARVYVSLPREGGGAASAAQIVTGLRVAVAERDAIAGGSKIRFVWMNDAKGARWNATRVRANARRAAADPKAVAYVGEGNSEATAVSMPIVNRAGLVHLSPVSTATTLTDPTMSGRYQPTGTRTFFRPIPGDARQSSALLSATRRAGGRARVVVIDDGTLYGRGLIQGFRAGAARARVRVVGGYAADRDGKGLNALAARVAAKRPTAIVYGGSPSSNAAKVLRALHTGSPRAVLLGGDALAHDHFVARLGTAQTRMRITTPAAHVDPRKRAGRRLGKRPDPFAVFAYNGMEALLAAIDRAGKRGTVTRASVRSAVFDGSVQRGLSGRWRITEHGDSVYGVFDILRAARGRIVTPVDRLSDQLVRQANAKGKGKQKAKVRAHGGRLGSRGSSGLPPSAVTLDSTDIASALSSRGAQSLDQVLEERSDALEQNVRGIEQLDEVLDGLRAVLARFPAHATSESRLDGTGPASSYAELVSRLRAAEAAAGVALGLGPDAAAWTRGQIEGIVSTVAGWIDQLADAREADMLLLQEMLNKQNEAFQAMLEFQRKMQEQRERIRGDMR